MKKSSKVSKKSSPKRTVRDAFPKIIRGNEKNSSTDKKSKYSGSEKETKKEVAGSLSLEERIESDPELSKALDDAYKSILSERMSLPVHEQELSKVQLVLHHFDMSAKYGPYLGMTRLERWRRAKRFELNPPDIIEQVLTLEEADEENRKRETLFYDFKPMVGE
ncbi:DNA polymerase delta subunit Cdm1 [Schizosaccharomyces cryophilus OY26]|uniref:DNA polymerase delta subunit Cdm1 n=1 Tax=Schizosaccharomyces cryophilus (strain OY26 / ATCC MYA-4695 / CBS 11777 / NBRC 106824 / NRRL Y48691) TaxID=653667 RepID=S9W8M6_SCHCR|nr:DNA polymerase delta subunit Cdm1 [Schizosaccharomyces cryophilus OY26]EPY54240.1 DNA polymerase delta subunit Cdm1 [Schizosaccharomyces cryophilus OY26]